MELARWKAPHGCDAVEPARPSSPGASTHLVAVATYALSSPSTRTGGVSLLDVAVGPDAGGSGADADECRGDSGDSSGSGGGDSGNVCGGDGSCGGGGGGVVGGCGSGDGSRGGGSGSDIRGGGSGDDSRGGGGGSGRGAVLTPRGAFSSSAVLDVRWLPTAAGSGRPAWPGDLLLACADGWLRRVGVAPSPGAATTPTGRHPEQGGTDDPATGVAAAAPPLHLTAEGAWAPPMPPAAGGGGGGPPLALSLGLVPPRGGDAASVFPPAPGDDAPRAAVVSYSSGAVAVLPLDADGGGGGGGPPSVFPAAHAAETWTAAALSATLLASGGDDGVLALWDTRSPPGRAAARVAGAHRGVGVTTVAPAGSCGGGGSGAGGGGAAGGPPTALWSGGYDDTLRLWDTRCLGGRGGDGGGGVSAVAGVGCGGGVWRVKACPADPAVLLVAAMYAGVRVVRRGGGGDGGGDADALTVVGAYGGHGEGLAYGVGWLGDGGGGRRRGALPPSLPLFTTPPCACGGRRRGCGGGGRGHGPRLKSW